MRFVFFIISAFSITLLYGQSNRTILDNKFKFREGIYTTNYELIENNPKYSEYKVEEKLNIGTVFGLHSYYFYQDENNKLPYNDSLFAYVNNGILLIKYQNIFYKPILVGPITTFFSELVINYSDQSSIAFHNLFFLDLLSGKIDRLYPENIEDIIERDKDLYSEYSSLSYRKQKKILYSFVLKYNSRNPIIIRQY